MKKASNFTYLSKRVAEEPKMEGILIRPPVAADLNVFVVTFKEMKQAEKNLAGGDPYTCKKCHAILNKYSQVLSPKQLAQSSKPIKIQLKPSQSLWQCQFCSYPNVLIIQKQQIPLKDDIVYMLESALESVETQNDSTLIFCIDISGSMNTTSQIKGKIDLKFGLSEEQIQMLKQFMEPGDQAQFNFLPGAHNKDKTFISRKQCILSAIQNQLQQLKKQDPYKKIGFVLFNNEVTVLGDGKTDTVNIVGDKLGKKQEIVNALEQYKLTVPLGECYEQLINNLNKTEAKGQTALGPGIIAAIEVASKGSKGSTVLLCTDGLANIGVGSLDIVDEQKRKFYQQLAHQAKLKNVTINIMTIKGQGSKLQVLGQLVEQTNGNLKVVNPQKLADDFANILKDEVVGLNVSTKIMLHKAMVFRNQEEAFLKDNKTVLIKQFANATVNTKVSFQYEVRAEEDLKFMQIKLEELKKVPFQAQITYFSPKGGRFLRVISSETKTTTQLKQAEKSANIGVVHQRIASNTAAMYSRGQVAQSSSYNNQWSDYLNNNFKGAEHVQKQEKFNMKNNRLNQAISNKVQKKQMLSKPQMEKMSEAIKEESEIKEEQSEVKGFFASIFSSKPKSQPVPLMKQQKNDKKEQKRRKQSVDSDEDQMEIRNNIMQKDEYNLD